MSAPEFASGAETIALRPLEVGDVGMLRALDEAYAERTGQETVVDLARLRHFARSGHAFVAYHEGGTEPLGMVLAHVVWDGARPVVRGTRLVAWGDDEAVLARLLEALVKSAFDAAVYDLMVELPETDRTGQAALRSSGFAPRPLLSFTRVLGSRGSVTP